MEQSGDYYVDHPPGQKIVFVGKGGYIPSRELGIMYRISSNQNAKRECSVLPNPEIRAYIITLRLPHVRSNNNYLLPC